MITTLFERFVPWIEVTWRRLKHSWRYEWGPYAQWRRIKRFVQRGIRGWSNEDTWSFDDHLTDVIIGGLNEIRMNSNGYPAALHREDDPDWGSREWSAILLKIINGFYARRSLARLNYMVHDPITGSYRHDLLLERRWEDESKEGMELFARWYDAFWT